MNPRECPYRGADAQEDVKPMNREQRRKAMKFAKGGKASSNGVPFNLAFGDTEPEYVVASDPIGVANQLDKCGIVQFFYNGILGDFARALIGFRLTNGISSKELADRLGVSLETLRSYERGNCDVPLRDIVKACLAIGFHVKIEGEL